MSHTFRIVISDEEYKAFELIVPDPDEWVEEIVFNKVRKCMIYVAEMIAKDPDAYLSPANKSIVEQSMINEGDIIKAPKDYSMATKKLMAANTTLPPRKQRDIEDLGELDS